MFKSDTGVVESLCDRNEIIVTIILYLWDLRGRRSITIDHFRMVSPQIINREQNGFFFI